MSWSGDSFGGASILGSWETTIQLQGVGSRRLTCGGSGTQELSLAACHSWHYLSFSRSKLPTQGHFLNQ